MADIRVRQRDGCRGGREQFTWNSVKDQEFKDREQYLGASTKVGTMGKFGRYYVHDWYARKRDTADSIDSEKDAVKAYEEELMQEALGLKPKKLMLQKKQLTEEEIKEYLTSDENKNADKQGRTAMGPQKKICTNEYGEQVAASNEDYIGSAAREAPIKGLGFASHRTKKLEEIKAATLGTEGVLQGKAVSSKAEVKSEVKSEVKAEPDDEDQRGAGGAAAPVGIKDEGKVKLEPDEAAEERRLAKKRLREQEGSQERRQRKSDKEEKKRKKAEKKLKKVEKKLKKAAKKEKKAAKLRRKNESVSSESSSSS